MTSTPLRNKKNATERKDFPVENRTVRITLMASLCALAIVGRIALSAIPNVQPVTVLLMLIALYFGVGWSAACTVIVVLVTNFFLGMGIWTFHQIAVWALIVAVTGLLFRRKRNPVLLTAWAVAMGYVYGFLISLFQFGTFVKGDIAGFAAYYAAGLLFDTYHALGNGIFMWVLLPLFGFLMKNSKTSV